MTRAPTQTEFQTPTPTRNAAKLDTVLDRYAQMSRENHAFYRRVEVLEKQMIALRGLEGMDGLLGVIRREQERSAKSQGERIGKLEAVGEKTKEALSALQKDYTDTRARLFAIIATVLALASLGVGIAKAMGG